MRTAPARPWVVAAQEAEGAVHAAASALSVVASSMANNQWDAVSYDTTFGFVTRFGNDLIDTLNPTVGQQILDLGCGPGRHAAEMASRGADVVGMDAVPEELRDQLAAAIDAYADQHGLRSESGWMADYCRLRFSAVAV